MIGQACRLPGAANVHAFRTLLQDGRCVVTTVPKDRWNHDLYLHPKPGVQGKTYSFAAGVLDDIWGFDLSVFNISPREAAQMDPQQRLLLQVVWEALEDAHVDPAKIAGQRVGVYVGASSMDHAAIMGRDPSLVDAYLMAGNTLSLVANRISHAFDLRGPSFVVDTACSSSLVALDQAQRALASGDIDTAIVAGVNILLNPSSFIGFSAARMLSPAGLCQSFSNTADGYVRAEGCVAVVLSNADTVPRRARAKLIDSEVNADGFTMNVSLPSEDGQYQLLSRLYERAQIEPDQLAFVEAHGTGTLVGDPIEAHALGRAIARHRCAPLPIGSSKTNVGHLEPASGLVGVLKTLIAFEDRRLPASLHAPDLNSFIDFDDLNLTLARKALNLPNKGDLVAGVSSFGFGGVNAHCILQAVERKDDPPLPAEQSVERLIVTSAFCDAALRQVAAEYADRFGETKSLSKGGLVDQMWAARGLHTKRLGVLADTADAAADALNAFAEGRSDKRVLCVEGSGRARPTVFAYSGNGAQYRGMCVLALEHDAAYREMFEQVDDTFKRIAQWSPLEKLENTDETTSIAKGYVAQGLLFADQASQTYALAARGIRPDAVLGHSGGEISAAWASGALSLEQAVNLMVHRSTMQSHIEGKGSMVALQASASETETVLASFVDADPAFPISIAAINSPRSVTLAGPKSELARFSKWVKRAHRLACVNLGFNYPYHSVLLAPHEAEFRESLSGLVPKAATVPFFSSTRGKKVRGIDLDAGYWWDNMRWHVQFESAIKSAAENEFDTFLEIGANPVLGNYIAASIKEHAKKVTIAHTLSKSDPKGANPIARAAMRAVISGCTFDDAALFAAPAGPQIALPTYPWQASTLRATDSPEVRREMGTSEAYHPLLGTSVVSSQGIWRRELDDHILPALRDHKVGHNALLPATAFAEMAFAAARQIANGAPVEVTDLDISAPLILSGGQGLEVITTADIRAGQIKLQSRSRLSQDAFRDNMQARFTVLSKPTAPPAQSAPDPIEARENGAGFLYKNAARVGLDYGPAFQGVTALRVQKDIVEVELSDTLSLGGTSPSHGFDPVQMDCLLHGLIEATRGTEFERIGQAFVPIRIQRLQVFGLGNRVCSGRLHIRKMGTQSMLVDVTGFDQTSDPVVRFEGLRLQAVFLKVPIDFDQHAYHFSARPCLPSPRPLSIDIAKLEAALESVVSAGIATDDSQLLITAATHQSIWSVFRDNADKTGIYKIPLPDHGAEETLLGMLSTLSLAIPEPDTGDWRIAEVCDIPDAQDIAHSLLAERPDLISELSALFRLPEALKQVLTRTADTDLSPETLFGREAIQSIGSLDPQAAGILTAALSTAIEAIPLQSAAKIALLGPDLRALEGIQGQPAGIDLIEIRPPEHTGPARQSRYQSFNWDQALGFDVIAISEPAVLAQEGVDAWLETALDAGGILLVLNQNEPALRRAMLATAAGPCAVRSRSGLIRQRIEALGLTVLLSHPLPDGASGGQLLIARKPPVGQHPLELSSPTVSKNRWSDLWAKLHGPNEISQDADSAFSVAVPHANDAPLLILRKSGASSTLAQSILQLRDIILDAATTERSFTAFLPHGAQYAGSDAADPDQHALWCCLRTAANEYPALKIRVIDTGDLQDYSHHWDVFKAINDFAPEEAEIVISGDSAMALRVVQGLPPTAVTPTALRLARPISGRLDGLKWQSYERSTLGVNDVEVEIAASGLNYRDVMWALGLLPEEALESGFVGPTLGLECAGQVVRVGANVTRVRPGENVVAFGPSCFATHLTSDEAWVIKLPPDVPLDQAATLPTAYFTAHYALRFLGQLKPGETVLIHGAAGGVGLAAIAIAQEIGAQIIATAGSPVKQQFLRELGVEHVLSSRDLDFRNQVRDLTNGQGVDVVLNSLAGVAMEASLGILRPFGRFLELGKQDYYTNTSVGMRPFKNNIAYFGIDVDSLLLERPVIAQNILQDMMKYVANGRYPPLPMTRFEGVDVVAAFRLMQCSGQIGKIVVAPPPQTLVSKASTRLTKLGQTAVFEPDPMGWHVLAGGLGGLGMEIAERLHLKGAKRLVLLSRSGTVSSPIARRIEMIRSDGTDLRVIQCDITDKARLSEVLEDLRKQAKLSGIYHSAMVLEDQLLADIDTAVLDRVLPVKTIGLTNLDRQTRADNLQAFVTFSSLASMIGNFGQTAYVAANAYQEAVIKRRVSEGFPGLCVGWGAITDVGYVARDATLSDLLVQMSGNIQFPAAIALSALWRLMATPMGDPCVTITPMSWPNALGQLRVLRQPSHEILRRLAEASGQRQNTGILRADLLEMNQSKAIKRTVEFLKSEIATILRVSAHKLSATRPLADYGMDSLMGVELGLAVQQALGDDLPLPTLGDSLTIEAMASAFVIYLQSGGSDANSAAQTNPNQAALQALKRQHLGAQKVEAAE